MKKVLLFLAEISTAIYLVIETKKYNALYKM